MTAADLVIQPHRIHDLGIGAMVIRDQDVRLDGLYHLLDDAVHVLWFSLVRMSNPSNSPLLSSTTTSISTLSP